MASVVAVVGGDVVAFVAVGVDVGAFVEVVGDGVAFVAVAGGREVEIAAAEGREVDIVAAEVHGEGIVEADVASSGDAVHEPNVAGVHRRADTYAVAGVEVVACKMMVAGLADNSLVGVVVDHEEALVVVAWHFEVVEVHVKPNGVDVHKLVDRDVAAGAAVAVAPYKEAEVERVDNIPVEGEAHEAAELVVAGRGAGLAVADNRDNSDMGPADREPCKVAVRDVAS